MNIALTGANHADAHAEREKKLEEILKMYIRHIKGGLLFKTLQHVCCQ